MGSNEVNTAINKATAYRLTVHINETAVVLLLNCRTAIYKRRYFIVFTGYDDVTVFISKAPFASCVALWYESLTSCYHIE